MKHFLLALGLLGAAVQWAGAAPATAGAAVGQWTMDVDAAKALAAGKKLPLLYNFTGSDWCGWCKLMDKRVFSEEAWNAYATQNLVLVWLDFPQDEALVPEKFRPRNRKLSADFGVEGYPTYVVLDSDGTTELGRLGADREITPAKFISQLEGVLENRPDAVAAMTADMGEEQGATYGRQRTRLAEARAERAKVEADAMAALKRLDQEIDELERSLASGRIAWKLSKLSAAQRVAYQDADKAYEAKRAELQAWLATQPDRNEANSAKFEALTNALAELEAARDLALKGGAK